MRAAAATSQVVDIVRGAKALVFDFDGTLVQSNAIKWRAFEFCFEEFPDRLEEIMAYCLGQHHTPRWEKFRHVYEKILGLPYTPTAATMLHERFAAATTSRIIEAPEVSGASQFLQVAARTRVTAVLSSTPHEILLQILEERGWQAYFETIRGAPVEKASWLQSFREKRGFHEEEIVSFGDTPEDARAALQAHCTFVAVAQNPLVLNVVHSIADFTRLFTYEAGHRAILGTVKKNS